MLHHPERLTADVTELNVRSAPPDSHSLPTGIVKAMNKPVSSGSRPGHRFLWTIDTAIGQGKSVDLGDCLQHLRPIAQLW